MSEHRRLRHTILTFLICLFATTLAGCTGAVTLTDDKQTATTFGEEIPLSEKRVVSVDKANLRAGPGSDYPQTGILEKGQVVQVEALSSDKLWYRVLAGTSSDDTWVLAEFLAKPSAGIVAGASNVNIRSGPGPIFSQLSTVTETTQLDVLARNRDCSWIKVETPDKMVGWISSYYVDLESPCSMMIIVDEIEQTTTIADASGRADSTAPGQTQIHPLLPAPTLLRPEGNYATDAPNVTLEWTSVKDVLGDDEYYVVTIDFLHDNHRWQDYAYTKSTKWSTAEHKYLLELAQDGSFTWSVQLIQALSRNEDGVPVGVPLSRESVSNSLVWKQPTIAESDPTVAVLPTPGFPCPYPGVCLATNHGFARSLAVVLWLGMGLAVGTVFLLSPSRRNQQ